MIFLEIFTARISNQQKGGDMMSQTLVTETLAKRLEYLTEKKRDLNYSLSDKKQSNEMGMPYGTFNKYLRNAAECPITSLKKLSVYYGVSTDFLLGITDVETPDIDLKSICEYCGLNDVSTELLHALKENDIAVSSLISELLCNNDFLDMARNILSLKNDSKQMRQSVTNYIEKGSSICFSDKDLDVSRYAVHRALEKILDGYDFRCDSDYHDIENKVVDRIDASLIDHKK